MNLKRKFVVAIFCSLAVGQLQAAPSAVAEADIYWNTFVIQGYPITSGLAPTINWNTQSTSVDAFFSEVQQSDSSNDWTSSLSVSAGGSQLSATSSLLHSVSQESGLGSQNSSTSLSRVGEFTVNGNGILVISFNYTLKAALEPGDNFGWNNAYASLTLYSEKLNSTISFPQYVSDEVSIYDWSLTPATASQRHDSTMNLAMVVKSGEQYRLALSSITQSGVSSVPIPAAAWLFMSSIAGYLGLVRRRIL